MQILLVSDLHYTLKQLDWVSAVAGEFDLVVLAGDHLDIASIVEPDAQIAVVLEYMARMAAKTSVAACSGNHDLNGRNEHGELSARWLAGATASGVLVDGTRLETEKVFVTVCPEWDGQAALRRRGPRPMDRAVLARHRALRPRARIAVQGRRRLVRPDRHHHGRQRRPPARSHTGLRRDRHRSRKRPVVVAGRRRG